MTLRGPSLRRFLMVSSACSLAVIAVAGCSGTPPTDQSSVRDVERVSPLPQLDPAQQAREMVAETESAIGLRLDLLAELADQCAECKTVLKTAQQNSADRLTAAGGKWDPWSGAVLKPWSEGKFQELAAIPEPGFTTQSTAGYMAVSATKQLTELAKADGISASERLALSGLLLGRYSSAITLASQFKFTLTDAQASVPSDDVPAFSITGHADAPSNTQSGTRDETDDSAGQNAIVQFDCIAGALIANIALDADAETTASQNRVAERIQSRTIDLSSRGVSDKRTVRCTLKDSASEALSQELIRTDLSLTGSQNAEVRQLAIKWAIGDTDDLAVTHPELLTTVSLLHPAPTDDGKQS